MTENFTGTWTLHSFEIENSDTNERSPWGKEAHGLLIYSPSGHMSVSINKKIERDDTQTECEDRFDSILFYSGTYQVTGDKITHQVTQASNPDRIGREMIRFAKYRDGQLELTTPKEKFGRAILTWKKIK